MVMIIIIGFICNLAQTGWSERKWPRAWLVLSLYSLRAGKTDDCFFTWPIQSSRGRDRFLGFSSPPGSQSEQKPKLNVFSSRLASPVASPLPWDLTNYSDPKCILQAYDSPSPVGLPVHQTRSLRYPAVIAGQARLREPWDQDHGP